MSTKSKKTIEYFCPVLDRFTTCILIKETSKLEKSGLLYIDAVCECTGTHKVVVLDGDIS